MFGCTANTVIPIDPGSWSLVLMPDTQNYSASATNISHFNAQTQWMAYFGNAQEQFD